MTSATLVPEATELDVDLRRVAFSIFQGAIEQENPAIDYEKIPTGKVILVTSPVSGEGVTWIATQICRELARDPKRRTLYCTMNGLAHVPVSTDEEIEKRCHLNDVGFWTISSRPGDITDWDFDPSARRAIVDPLRRCFDYVIVDCPSVCESADVAAVASMVSSCLLVIGAGRSTRRQLQYAEQVIVSSGGVLGGCIFNRRQSAIPKSFQRFLRGNLS
jgi:Mrp family chromosome partitioning ATPase